MMIDFYSIKIKTLISYFMREQWSFIALCIYLLFEYVRPQSLYPAINILPFNQLFILIAFFALVLEGNKLNFPNTINKLMVVMSVLIILSSFFAYRPQVSYEYWTYFTQWVFVYYLVTRIINNEKRFFVFMLLFLLFSFKMSQHGFISWASRGFSFSNWGVTGSPGWFHNSGEFGIQLCVFVPLSIYFIIALSKYWGRIKLGFFLLMPVTGIGSVIATSSRGAMAGLVFAMMWMLLKSQHKISTLVVIAIVGSVLIAYTPEESKKRFESSGSDSTSVMRMNRWVDGIDMMNNNPLLGIGYYNWEVYYPKYYYRPNIGSLGAYGLSHNIFIQAGAELGYTGLIVYILLILYCFIFNYRTRRLAEKIDNQFIYYMAHGLDAALVGFLVSGSFVTVMYYPYLWVNLAMTVSLLNIARIQNTKKINEEKRAVSTDNNVVILDNNSSLGSR